MRRGVSRLGFALAFGLALLPLGAAVAQNVAEQGFLILNVRVFDGERTLERGEVAVVGATIREVGTTLSQWRGLRVIDGAGGTLLPGLIDAHVHVRDADDLRQSLRFGVTTVLDLGAVVEPEALFALRAEASRAGDMADLRLAGVFAWSPASAAAMDGAPHMSISVPPVTTVDAAVRFVDARREEGADYVKIGLSGVRSAATGEPNMDVSVARALVERAHEYGMRVVAHVETFDDVDIALAARVDGLAHVWRRGGANADVARRIVERGVFVMPTFTPLDGFMPDSATALLADPRFADLVTDRVRAHLARPFSPPPGAVVQGFDPRANRAGQFDAVRSLHAAGAKVLAATDANRDSPGVFGISLHRELELLREAGLSATEALAAATARAADAFGLTDRGRIVTGRRADLLLVRGDPTSDILATRAVARVWKAGVELEHGASAPSRDP